MHDEAAGANIALIGPMPPHRGGIAQYGLHLHRALAEFCWTTTFAFSRQYPVWFYPGKSDIDPDAEPVEGLDVRRTIDSLNPFSWLSTVDAITALKPAALVIQWWTVFWWPTFMVVARRIRRRGIPIILLCHNVVDHESSPWKERLSASMLRIADGYIVHSAAHRDFLEVNFPGRPIMQAPIPSYSNRTAGPRRTLARRGRLELLFFGFMRPYKGLDVLLDALEIIDDPEVYLTVAGEAWGDCRQTVERLRRRPGRNIEAQLEFISEAKAAELFDRADAVVLPYLAASGSAVTALAYGFDRPVIASRVGGLIDVVIEGETGILVEPGDANALAQVLRSATREQLSEMSSLVAHHREAHGWPRFAADVRELVSRVVGGSADRKEVAR